MNISRLYTGADGQTHMEWMHLEDWHPAPRRQFVITISGEVEIGLGDGSVHRYGAGHVNLAEDLTGQGHTTRVVGDQPRVTATIPLA